MLVVNRRHTNKIFLVPLFALSLAFNNRALAQCAVSAGPDTSTCSGQTVTITATPISGNPGNFIWTSIPAGTLPNGSTINVNPTTTTLYIVHALGNGCNVRDTMQVTVYAPPASPAFTYKVDNSCSGTNVSFSVNAQNSNTSYAWNFGDSTSGTGAAITHPYNSYGNGGSNFIVTVTATGANGCTSAYTQVVNIPQKPGAFLLQGPGVDTSTFNGLETFYICAAADQTAALFTFVNGYSAPGYTSTIIWGDTAAPFVTDTTWTSVNHIYTRGIYNLAYAVTNDSSGCTDTTIYKVFYGSNPAGGIVSPGNTDICGPGWLTFGINGWQSNSPGTIYEVSFSDSTPTLIFSNPPPDSISHYFQISSCGYNSSNGIINFPNSFSASLEVINPCGVTAGAIVPIYVSLKPIANFTFNNVCTNTPAVFTNTTTDGMAAGSSGCNQATPVLWSISPDTGWTITAGSLGSSNGYSTPALWTSGSNTLTVSFTAAGNYQFQIVAGNKCTNDTMTKTVCVTDPPSPTFSISISNSSVSGCAPVLDTILNTSAVSTGGGCSTPSFAWTITQGAGGASCAGDSTNNFVFLDSTNTTSQTSYLQFNNPGQYSINLNAQNVCGVFTSTQTVTVKAPPQISISAPSEICINTPVTPSVTQQACGGTITNYSWNFPGGTPSSSTNQNPGGIGYNAMGNYNISLTASNECGTVNANTSVKVDTIPVAIAGNSQQMCSGGNVQIGTTPLPGLIYSWTPTTGLSSPSVANPTATLINNGNTVITQVYYLTVSNNGGCSTTDSVTITVYPPATVNAGPDLGACAGQSVTLQGSLGGAATSATWTSSGGGVFSDPTSPTSIFTPSAASGTVTLTLTTNQPTGPCPAASSTMQVMVVPPPVANAGNNVSVCSGSSVKIGTAKQNGYNYSWTPSTGLDKNNIATPTVTIANNSDTVISRTYTLVVSATGCSDTAQVTVSVYPAVQVNAGASAPICAGGTIQLNGTISGGATSATWGSPSGVFSQPDSLQTNFTPSITSGAAVVTLTTNQPAGPCPAATATINVTVNPAPLISSNPVNQDICAGNSSQTIWLNSNVPGTAFSWTGSSPDGLTGFTANGTAATIPAQSLNNNSTSSEHVIYTVTASAAGCAGSPVSDTITVNPVPAMNAPANQTICSGSATTAVHFSSSTNGTTFSWVAASTGNPSGYTFSGTGDIPAQTINNNDGNTDTVTYTITPSANGCSGAPVQMSIIVNPAMQVQLPPSQAVCSGSTIGAINIGSNIPGAIFSWTGSASSGVTGYISSGTGSIPSQTLTNSSTSAGSVIYTVTASGAGCNNVTQNYMVTVEPPLTATAFPVTDTVCTGVQINISLTANIPGATFSWTTIAPPPVSGASPGTGSQIQQILNNSSQNPQTVTYIITPSANDCPATPDSATVVINPGLIIQFSPTIQTICSGQTSQPVNISSSTIGSTFTWTASSTELTGLTTSGTGNIPAQTLVNGSFIPDTAIFTVVPNTTGCPGQTATYYIIVNPGPSATLPGGQTVCSGNPTQVIVFSSNITGITYNWTASATNGITGFTANGTSDSIPSQTLTNPGNTAGQLAYTVTPNANGCTGPPVNYVVQVNPQPSVNAPAPQTLCTGNTTSAVTLSSPVPGTTFNWTSAASAGLSGNIASGTGNIPAQQLTNPGNVVDTVTYTIIPSARGCYGNPQQFIVVVNPQPVINLPEASQLVCSGHSTQEVKLTSSVSNSLISWVAKVPSGVVGAISSGTAVIPAQVLYNITNNILPESLTINYNINTALPDGSCATNNSNYYVTVNPKPQIDFTSTSGSGCAPITVEFMPSTMNIAGPDSLTFNWGDGTPVTTLYGNNTIPVWSTVQHKFSNTGTQSVTYNVSLTVNNGCYDTTVIHPITISPNALNVFFTPSQSAGCEPLTVTFQDKSTAGSILSWCFNYNTTTNTCNGPALVDSAGAAVTHTFTAGTYTVALYATNASGCAQDTVYQTITVSPAPVAAFTPSATLCSQMSVSFTNQSTPPTGSFLTAFNWQFGDGSSSTNTDPQHVYTAAGNYSACLAAISSSGCTDTVCHSVSIQERPQVAFTFPNACVNQQTGAFVNQSTGANLYKWFFGDGVTSADSNPVHPYLAAGTYQVELVGIAGNCSDTTMQTVVIYPIPQAAFTVPENSTCGLPSSLTMNNTSTGAIGYNWNFGNGTGSTYPDPTVTYTAAANYIISLAAVNQFGCSDSTSQPVAIFPFPVIQSVNVLPANGCAPQNVHFDLTAINAHVFDWNFGDGTSTVTNDTFMNHIYTQPGTYSVTLEVYSINNCGDTVLLPDTITIHVNPTASFDYMVEESSQESDGVVDFTNTSQNADSYVWDFGDGSTSIETNPSHMYGNVSQFDVMLIASTNYGCKDTAMKSIDVIKKSLYAPNAFAPDYNSGSPLVQMWKPTGMGLRDYHAQIFDQWGELLWESTALTPDLQPAEGWDGTYQGKTCQQDVYVWKIDAVFVDGTRWLGMTYPKEHERKTIGSVTLVR